MTNFEKAVKIIGEDFRQYSTWQEYKGVRQVKELIDIWCYTSKELKDEIFWTMMREGSHIPMTADLEIEEADGTKHSYRKLAKAVREYTF